ncbi:MAG: hypothetical protein A3J93_02460 [Candidatus Magasanikbacteria bacterium RIFOXYC2_FULL_42_28]|uniref:Uncharacterized protein n=1 Tax=Candidatus Magasanikbacteria bacterium RIFOXYC2_FULL_42_28 TaxID=1798704 RepID=A0A1F6NW18_9BACT|nr:MAG: hypothetical protein A3J93_02460 [Candidatus Magasanikbacteria bacterium RIFOXYC2_FULL_42_28]
MRLKFILVSIFVGILLLGAPALNHANAVDFGQNTLEGVAKGSGYEIGNEANQLSSGIGYIISVTLSLVGMIFFALAVYAGFLWMTAGGNDEQITKAVNILKASVIGMIIALAAFSITFFVTLRFTSVTGTSAGWTTAGGTTHQSNCTALGGEAYQPESNSDFGDIVDWFDALVGGVSCQVDPATQEEIPGTCCMPVD